ncbi:putative sulfoacetate transporter SauU [Neomoorella glycerini]|uniref:Putative sulfoacetate transporter SauU n=1 Tax=Neomoorella glycerini TaxID=55779 RepID=A0A6I5ZNF6_9FIRM|nr:MFS transporter [Moorella glycerini]QGP91137.1 putative sulfoacetate transporter SauU [Moorella glycerini]
MAVENKPVEATRTSEMPITWYSWIIIALCMLSYAVSFVDRNVWSTAIPVAAPAMKLSMTAAGGLMTAFYIGYVVANFVSGWFVDRFGPRLTLGLSSLVTGLFTLLLPFGNSYATLFILRIIAGAGSGALFSAGVKFQLGWFPKSARATAMGIMMTGPTLGSAIASGALAPVIRTSGWQTAFTYAGIMTIVVALAVLLFAKERGIAKASPKGAIGAGSGDATKPVTTQSFLSLVLKRSFLLGCIACFLSIGANQGFTTWIIAYFTKVRGFSLVVAGGIFAASSMVGLFGPTLAGFLCDLLKRRKAVCLVGAVGVALIIVALALTTNTSVLWGIMLVRGLIGPFLGIPLNTLQAESVAGPQAGSAMGFYNGIAQLGSVVFPIGLGLILDLTANNYFIVLMAIAITYLLCGTLIAFMDEKRATIVNTKTATA